MERATFYVPQLHCDGCARIIREGLENAPGVRQINVDVPASRVAVTYDPAEATADALGGHIREAGFSCSEEREEPSAKRRPEKGPTRKRAPKEPAAAEEPRPGLWYWLLALGVAILAIAGYAGYELYPRFDLPAAQGIGLFLLAGGAGIASFFSPCAFPLLVTLLARETGVRARGVQGSSPGAQGSAALSQGLKFATALSAGAAGFLLLAGIGIALGGGALFAGVTFTSTAGMTIRIVVGAFLILLGLVQLGKLPNPLHAIDVVSRPLMRRQAEVRRKNVTIGFAIFGFGYLLAGFG